jgi:hypothetical protein
MRVARQAMGDIAKGGDLSLVESATAQLPNNTPSAPAYLGKLWIDQKTAELLGFGSVATDIHPVFPWHRPNSASITPTSRLLTVPRSSCGPGLQLSRLTDANKPHGMSAILKLPQVSGKRADHGHHAKAAIETRARTSPRLGQIDGEQQLCFARNPSC